MAEFVLSPQVQALALRRLGDLRGDVVVFVSVASSKPIRDGPGGHVTANGGLCQDAQFRVCPLPHGRPARHELGPVVRLQNVATNRFLAVKGGRVTVGTGGPHCELIVHGGSQFSVGLRKHSDPDVRVGFHANGQPAAPRSVGDGSSSGRFFMFDYDRLAGLQQQRRRRQQQQQQQQQQQPVPQQSWQQPILHSGGGGGGGGAGPAPHELAQAAQQLAAIAQQQAQLVAVQTQQRAAAIQQLAAQAAQEAARAAQRAAELSGQQRQQPYHHQQPQHQQPMFMAVAQPVPFPVGHPAHVPPMLRSSVVQHPPPPAGQHPPPIPMAHVVAAGPAAPPSAVQPVQFVRPPPMKHPSTLLPHQRCLLRVSDDPRLHVNIQGGSFDGRPAVLHGDHRFAAAHTESHFVFRPTAHPDTYIIQLGNTNMFLHAKGGSREGAPIVAHGNEVFAQQQPHSKFVVVPMRGGAFALRVHDGDLYVRADGGSRNNAPLRLRGPSSPHSQFYFIAH